MHTGEAIEAGVRAERLRSFVLRVILCGWIALSIANFIVETECVSAASRVAREQPVSGDELRAIRRHASLPASVGGYIDVATIAAWLLWQYRAYANLRLVGSGTTRTRPAITLGYWFVPWLMWTAPCRVFKELWIRSAARNATSSIDGNPMPRPVLLWWCASVATFLSTVIRIVLINRSPSLHADAAGFEVAARFAQVNAVLWFLSAASAILVVTRIHRMQSAFSQGGDALDEGAATVRS